jgi:hypothetical protein
MRQSEVHFFQNLQEFERFYLLRYNAVESVESQPTFRKNMTLPSEAITNKTQVVVAGNSLHSVTSQKAVTFGELTHSFRNKGCCSLLIVF